LIAPYMTIRRRGLQFEPPTLVTLMSCIKINVFPSRHLFKKTWDLECITFNSPLEVCLLWMQLSWTKFIHNFNMYRRGGRLVIRCFFTTLEGSEFSKVRCLWIRQKLHCNSCADVAKWHVNFQIFKYIYLVYHFKNFILFYFIFNSDTGVLYGMGEQRWKLAWNGPLAAPPPNSNLMRRGGLVKCKFNCNWKLTCRSCYQESNVSKYPLLTLMHCEVQLVFVNFYL